MRLRSIYSHRGTIGKIALLSALISSPVYQHVQKEHSLHTGMSAHVHKNVEAILQTDSGIDTGELQLPIVEPHEFWSAESKRQEGYAMYTYQGQGYGVGEITFMSTIEKRAFAQSLRADIAAVVDTYTQSLQDIIDREGASHMDKYYQAELISYTRAIEGVLKSYKTTIAESLPGVSSLDDISIQNAQRFTIKGMDTMILFLKILEDAGVQMNIGVVSKLPVSEETYAELPGFVFVDVPQVAKMDSKSILDQATALYRTPLLRLVEPQVGVE